jgi:hypothetical protein
MSTEDDLIEVELVDEPIKKDEPVIVVETVKAKETEDPKEAVADQLRKYEETQEADRKAREAADARAVAAEQRAKSLEGEVATERKGRTEASQAAIDNAITAVEGEASQAEQEYAAAMEAGDFKAAATAQRKIAKAERKLGDLENGKAELTRAKPEPAVTKKADPADPFEQYVSQFSPRSQSYLRKNASYVTDKKLNDRLLAAHYEASAEGHVLDSDAYFDFIDHRMGKTVKEPEKKADEPRRSERRASAPVSRDTGTSNGKPGANVVKLTPGEVATAEALGLTNAEYARRKVAMQKEGRYDQ